MIYQCYNIPRVQKVEKLFQFFDLVGMSYHWTNYKAVALIVGITRKKGRILLRSRDKCNVQLKWKYDDNIWNKKKRIRNKNRLKKSKQKERGGFHPIDAKNACLGFFFFSISSNRKFIYFITIVYLYYYYFIHQQYILKREGENWSSREVPSFLIPIIF